LCLEAPREFSTNPGGARPIGARARGKMDLAAICEVLQATQLSDGALRSAAEQKLNEAASGSPKQLVAALATVLAGDVAVELRQEAAVILRQIIAGTTRESVWSELDEQTQRALMGQLLSSLSQDSSRPVRRSVGQAIAATARSVAEDLDELTLNWPELLPALSRFVGSECETETRVVALGVLKSLAETMSDGFMEKAGQLTAMLTATLQDASPEVRAAGAQLVLQLVESLEAEAAAPLAQVMPAVTSCLQGFANEGIEEPLKETLEALIAAADAEPEFFKETGMEALWATLLKLCSCGAQAFSCVKVRHSAMEAAMSLAVGLDGDFSKPEDQALLEQLVALNVEWMLEVEEDVDVWLSEGKDDDQDECDDEAVRIGEINLDHLAEEFDEDILMPLIFKVIQLALQSPTATWKHTRAAVMAISQVVEHIEDTAWVDRCVEFIAQNLNHLHPRVRYASFWGVAQVSYDHSPYVQETHHETLLPAILQGISDTNIRVATSAVHAFMSLGEELDAEDLDPHMDDLLTKMFQHLADGQSRVLQENCLSGIAILAEAAEELFVEYYGRVVPMLKQIIQNATGEKDRSLRGKAFSCASIVGSVVGKEMFSADAHEIMQVMMQLMLAGFAGDDPLRESCHEAASKMAETLGKDFKPYVPALLPGIFTILQQRPEEIDPAEMPDDDDDDERDMSLTLVGEKVLGLKTSVLSEMKEALDLCNMLVRSLSDDFIEFMPAVCQNLLPLLDFRLSEDLRERAFRSWELLAGSARAAVEHGVAEMSVLQELVGQFLRTVMAAMAEKPEGEDFDQAALGLMKARAMGVSGVIRKAGEGVLTKDVVRDVSAVILQVLASLDFSEDESREVPVRRGAPVSDEDDELEGDGLVSRQQVRFCLVDVAGALVHSGRDFFIEIFLPPLMEMVVKLLRPDGSELERSLAFYIVDDIVDSVSDKSIPYWNGFMNQALQGMVDKSAMVRQYAASTIGHAARQPIFAQMAPSAAMQIHRVLQKHGERHRRRRAVKADAKQNALAVDSCIKALGYICEHHEAQLGTDAGTAWQIWLSNLPLRYDQDAGQRTHAQLLGLVARSHPAVTSQEQLPKVLAILADVYETGFSTTALDREIASTVSRVGEEPLMEICSGITEKQQKKVKQMLRGAQAGA